MKLQRLWLRQRRDERGASLVLAIVFMVVVSAVGGSVLASISSSLNDGAALARARNREYAADAGVERAIAQVRTLTAAPGIGFAQCSPGSAPNGGGYSSSLDGVSVHVDCQNAPTLTQSGFLQRNVIFSACPSGPCIATNTIIRAEVNFEAITQANGSLLVTNTTVQSWSVNQ